MIPSLALLFGEISCTTSPSWLSLNAHTFSHHNHLFAQRDLFPLSSTDAVLDLVKDKGLITEDVERIEITMTPYPYKLVRHHFEVRDNPRVSAQFNVRCCVASALLRTY